MLLVAMKGLWALEFERPVLKTRVQSENWIEPLSVDPMLIWCQRQAVEVDCV